MPFSLPKPMPGRAGIGAGRTHIFFLHLLMPVLQPNQPHEVCAQAPAPSVAAEQPVDLAALAVSYGLDPDHFVPLDEVSEVRNGGRWKYVQVMRVVLERRSDIPPPLREEIQNRLDASTEVGP